jgi:glucose-1-phosphate cytidylyltransferase
MQVVILAGGLGTRISEETDARPKPMIEIGGRPLIWHIMKIYSHFGMTDFIVCLGYRGYVIKEYFLNYFAHNSDLTIDLSTNTVELRSKPTEQWRVTLVDTGATTQTGGRIKRVAPLLKDDTFCLTYGDAVADLDLRALVDFHRRGGTWATVTAVRPMGRFGAVTMDGSRVVRFEEKPIGDGGWINGGFFVLDRRIMDTITDDATIWEHGPMTELTQRGELAAYAHHGFWQCLDTLRDKRMLEEWWNGKSAPWRVWDR